MLQKALNEVMLPVMDELIAAICDMATTNALVPMLSRTHGQRDLTDSTVLRNMGVELGHSLLAYKTALQGIAKLQNRPIDEAFSFLRKMENEHIKPNVESYDVLCKDGKAQYAREVLNPLLSKGLSPKTNI